MLPSDEIVHLSFLAQQFLANSGHLSSKKFQQELEILNSTMSLSIGGGAAATTPTTTNDAYFHNLVNMVSNVFVAVGGEESAAREKKETKSRLAEIEKKLDEQLDSTQVLLADLNIASVLVVASSISSSSSSWNWLEIIRLFEAFLLERSSFYPRFAATRDAEFLRKHKRKIFAESQKLIKVLKKLFDFFSLNQSDPSHTPTSSASASVAVGSSPILTTQLSYSPRFTSPRLSQPNTALQLPNHLTEQIACVGCYLIDFCLG